MTTPPTDGTSTNNGNGPVRGRLFRKYVALFVGVVAVALAASGLLQMWFASQEQTESLAALQRVQADAAAARIGQFVTEIEGQIGWTTQLPWAAVTLDQRRFDGQRLLRQVPAISELILVDGDGLEQLRLSRVAMDVIGAGTDLSQDEKYTAAVEEGVYHGPVYFRRESEPYMTLAMAGTRRGAGVTIAEVNLKFIWDVVSQIEVGETGQAFVVDAEGRLIAHPDLGLVLRNTDMLALDQVIAARAGAQRESVVAKDLAGRDVLTTYAPIPALDWFVFVELPLSEARAPLYTSLIRTGILFALGLVLALLAGLFLARRMVVPIRALQAGAAEFGHGDLSKRIEVNTNDELETLAGEFNDMAGRLEESYAGLENKVERRTQELARTVEELKALGDVSEAVNETLDMQTVLDTIVEKAVQLSDTEAGAIWVFDEAAAEYRMEASYGSDDAFDAAMRGLPVGGIDMISQAVDGRKPIHAADVDAISPGPVRELLVEHGIQAVLVVPLLRGPGRAMGALVVRRATPGEFPESVVQLLQTFTAPSVLAIQNARLFRQIEERGTQLELASQHKSQFLANMSHELRTPLNAILGYTELILDKLYGELPEKVETVLGRVERNGRHLLGLINDVLDLSKIEAGRFTLDISDYTLSEMIESVVASTDSLASGKGLKFTSNVAKGMPGGRGDQRRLTQVMLNLVGNAIKFTDDGSVEIAASESDGKFVVSVRDTGPGIAIEDMENLFDEFMQGQHSSIARSKPGTGLGLTISKRIVAMHGGTITVESEVGVGSTFTVNVPTQVESKKEAAE